MNSGELNSLIKVAMGEEKADLALQNGSLVNVYTGEILEEHSVAVKGERIAWVGKDARNVTGPETNVIDCTGKFITPGFIDGHTHLILFYQADQFLKYAMRGGTTTIITELMELGFPLGYQGILEYLESLKDQPIKIFSVVPPMVTNSQRTRSRTLNLKQIAELLKRDDILGLGETYWQAVVERDEKILDFFVETFKAGKIIAGHSAGARGNRLTAYAAGGVRSCHESINVADVIERLRLGLYVLIREGGIRKELAEISKIKDLQLDLRQLILTTDSITPEQVIEEGYLEEVVQKAIDMGFDPVCAIQMATINVAKYWNLDHLIGGIAPSKYADIVVLPDLRNIKAEYVISNGKVLSKEGKLLLEPRKYTFPSWVRQSMRLNKKFEPEDFEINVKSSSDHVSIRVIEQISELVTKETILEVPVSDGKIKVDLDKDLIKIAAIDFLTGPLKMFVGLIKGFRMKKGAFASSMAWDLTNIVVIGADEKDMAVAVNRILELQGGIAVCSNGKILAELPMSIGGYMSDLPIEEIVQNLKDIQKEASGLGIPFPDAELSLNTLTTAAIPFFRICEEGFYDLRNNRSVGLLV
jgi:adenine deaminase